MPDLSAPIGGLFELLNLVLRPAIQAFLRTTAGMIVLGLLLAGGSFYWAAQGSSLRGVLAVLLACGLCAVFGLMLAVKRAVARGLLHGVQKLKIGSRLLKPIFHHVCGVSGKGQPDSITGAIGANVQSLPLAQAEERLSDAVRDLLAAPDAGGGLNGWLRRRLQVRLVRSIQKLTLKRFRKAGKQDSGIDLWQVRDELADTIDRRLGEQIQRGMRSATVLAVLLVALLALGGAHGIRQLPF
jgi:hypothetical protein